VAVGVGLAAAGIALVLSAPLDDDARSNLGIGLLTGLVVGVSMFALEYVIERRNEAKQQSLRDAEADFLIGRYLAELIVDSAQVVWMTLASHDAEPDSAAAHGTLPGFDPTGDPQRVMTGVHWVADLDRTGGDWFVDLRSIEMADVLVQAGLHQLTFVDAELSESDFDRIRYRVDQTAARVAGIAAHAGVHGDSLAGRRLLDVASNLREGAETGSIQEVVEVDLPRVRPTWSIEGDSEILRVGAEMTASVEFISVVVGYSSDILREVLNGVPEQRHTSQQAPGELPTGRDLVASQRKDTDIVQHRWSSLVTAAEAAPWANRFTEGSWFRATLNQAARAVRANYGLSEQDFAGDD
jgi:hypothetical protein